MDERITLSSDRPLEYLCEEYKHNNYIDPEISEKLGVKRGLRNADGTGVLAGLTNVCDVVGYNMVDGVKTPAPGKLVYRGIDVEELVNAAFREDRFVFEEVIWLLLFGTLPSQSELENFMGILERNRELPAGFVEDIIMKAPSPNIMNKMANSVLSLYSYDEDPEGQGLENVIQQSIKLVASLPTIMVNAWQVKRRVYDNESMVLHPIQSGQSTAEHILSTYRDNKKYTKAEARLLDLCLVLHADHGGGNNSTFSCRSLSSTGTDTYSAIAAGIGSLKGPKHGGANLKVMQMLADMREGVRDEDDDEEVTEYLRRVLRKQAGDGSGLIYGLGHAVYTISDPRAVILRREAAGLAEEKGFGRDYKLLCGVEKFGPVVFAQERGNKDVCANVDLFSGLIYAMLGISDDLFTPLFAISRIPGWCAHRAEEIIFANRIIRPAYKYLGVTQKYTPLEERV
ncbi:citrate synthase [Ruminococcaceae bacterium OttesenSCG-928-A11]|nr:citrate synthase [Ruminococcaceae bacterium OttesenSCG-928-A11]